MKRSKNWKKAACLLTLMCMLGSASACEMSFDQKDIEKTETATTIKAENISLKDRGLEVIEIMKEKIHSDAYMKTMLSKTLTEEDVCIKLRKCSYDTPDKIYRITMGEDAIDNLLKVETNTDADMESLSPKLRKVIDEMLFNSYVNMISSRAGAMPLAIQGSLVTEKTFVSDEKNVRGIYLYDYTDQYPIAVVFNGSEDGAVLAKGYFILNEDVKTESLEDVKQSFLLPGLAESDEINKAMGIQVEEIK